MQNLELLSGVLLSLHVALAMLVGWLVGFMCAQNPYSLAGDSTVFDMARALAGMTCGVLLFLLVSNCVPFFRRHCYGAAETTHGNSDKEEESELTSGEPPTPTSDRGSPWGKLLEIGGLQTVVPFVPLIFMFYFLFAALPKKGNTYYADAGTQLFNVLTVMIVFIMPVVVSMGSFVLMGFITVFALMYLFLFDSPGYLVIENEAADWLYPIFAVIALALHVYCMLFESRWLRQKETGWWSSCRLSILPTMKEMITFIGFSKAFTRFLLNANGNYQDDIPKTFTIFMDLPLAFVVMLLQQSTYHKFTSLKRAWKRGQPDFESIGQTEMANVFAVAAPVCGGCS